MYKFKREFKLFVIRLIAFFYFGLIASWAMANNLASQQLAQFNQTVQTARGEFTQIVFSQTGKIKQQSQGVFSFSRPGKFRWQITDPFPQTIVSNGKQVITYDPDLEQASIRSANSALESTPSALLFGQAQLDRLFKMTNVEKSLGDLNWLEAEPYDSSGLFNQIRIGWREQLPRVLEISDSLGQVTRLTLSNWETQVEFKPTEFELELPPGVDLLEIN